MQVVTSGLCRDPTPIDVVRGHGFLCSGFSMRLGVAQGQDVQHMSMHGRGVR